MTISRVLIRHTARVYRELSSRELHRPAAERSERRRLLLDALPAEFGTAEALETATKLGIAQKSAERYLREWRDSELIEHVAHGRYRKHGAAESPQTDNPSKPSIEGNTSTEKT